MLMQKPWISSSAKIDKICPKNYLIPLRIKTTIISAANNKGHVTTGYHPKMDTLDIRVDYADIFELKRSSWLRVLAIFNALTRKIAWEILEREDKKSIAAAIIPINSRQLKLSDVIWKSDKGPSFTADEVQNVLTAMNTEIKFGIPRSHQDESPIERSFKEIRKHLVLIIAQIADTYSGDYLKIALAIAFDIYNNIESVVGFGLNEAHSPLFYSARLRQEISEMDIKDGRSLVDKVVEIQDDIIGRMIANQGELFKKKMINTEGSTNPMKLRKGMMVLLIPEVYEKHEYKKTGCWEVIDIKTGENTDQWYVQLKDPTSQVNDFMV